MKSNRISKPPEVRKNEFLEVAQHLFLEKGYENVSVRDILKEVNGGPGMFYYYFDSKKQLFNEVIDNVVENIFIERRKIVEDKNISLEDKLEQIIELVINEHQQYRSALNDLEKDDAVITKITNRIVSRLSKTIKDALDMNGRVLPSFKTNEETAHFISYGIMGLIKLYDQKEKDSLYQKKVIMLYIKDILNGRKVEA